MSRLLVRFNRISEISSPALTRPPGYTDLPSRLPTQSSTLYSNNIVKFLLSMTPQEKEFGIDLSDEVVRGAIVTQRGDILPPAPRPAPPPAPAKPAAAEATPEPVALTPWQAKTREVGFVTGGMASVLALGKFTGPLFMSNAFTFALASLIGYRVIWGVAPALHSPLMSVTNAISGMVGVGGLFILGGGYFPGTIPQTLGALSVLLAFVNVGGGFVITKRMLDMFKREFYPLSVSCGPETDIIPQVLLILPSTRGCMPSPPPCLAEDSLRLPPLVLPALSRLVISLHLFSALAPYPVWLPRLLPAWVTCSACSVFPPVFSQACSPPASRPRS